VSWRCGIKFSFVLALVIAGASAGVAQEVRETSPVATGSIRTPTVRPPDAPSKRAEPETSAPSAVAVPETPPSRRDRAILQRFQASWRILVWPAGQPVIGCFMEKKNAAQRDAFLKATRAWTAHANLTFDFGEAPGYRSCSIDEPSDIRVSFRPALASRSEVGTLALDVAPGQPTLHISTGALGEQIKASLDDRIGIMIHELGHALGLPHEHQHPQSPCPAEYRFDLLCPREGTQHVNAHRYASVLAVYSGQRALIADPEPKRLLPYDVQSVMHYRYPHMLLKGGRGSACYVNAPFVLSDGDKAKMRLLYPKDPEVQRAMIREELKVLARAIGATGISAETAQSLTALVERRLERKFPKLGATLDLSAYVFEPRSQKTIAAEEALVAPLKAMTPVCSTRR
jgi:hypothetical protein